MVRNTTIVVCGFALLCGVLAGCGTGQREVAASAAAEAFLDALDRRDAAAACTALAPEATKSLTAAEGRSCEESLASQDLPGGAVEEVAVWGDRAQVRTDADVVFLAELDSGWKIVAAGCRPQGERPYLCEVGGS